ncbi:MAG: ATP-grasp domain-containing protein [Deltaproteobacteria bacterium]|nr:ATP-grasp domain-containing protein [Deltaproteobacteria bacterium]
MSEKEKHINFGFQDGIGVGIIGGGQLAFMLAQAAIRLGLVPHVLGDNATDSAARACPEFMVGRLDDETSLRSLLERVKMIVFENEFVDTGLLSRLAAERDIPCIPGPSTLNLLRDKASQKQCLKTLGIPTARFEIYKNGITLESWLSSTFERFGSSFVLKWAKMGYDGKGVLIVTRKNLNSALDFCKRAVDRNIAVYAEEKIPFKRELALVSCHSTKGEFSTYPLVISEQKENVCSRVLGPASGLGVSPQQQSKAAGYALKLARSTGLFGCFALELFELPTGGILVNEIAPRVHNSGHVTQDASRTSQFENHWRGVLGLPLGPTDCAPAFAMLNLLGPAGYFQSAVNRRLPVPGPGMHLHWYGKTDVRPLRKLGHLNGTVEKRSQLKTLLRNMEKCKNKWLHQLENV